MSNNYKFKIENPNFEKLGSLKVVANIKDKHDRSTPSNYHWKVLKCRMILFSASSILSCPDKSDVKQVHIIFSKVGNDYDCLTSLLLKFSLIQDGGINKVTSDIYQKCFYYTMSAKLAPVWNSLGYNYFINNRDFLKDSAPQDGIKSKIAVFDDHILLDLKPVKIHLLKSANDRFASGEYVRVLPSLNKAVIEECFDKLPDTGEFKCYKDLRRHWKNIHGYRLPEEEIYRYYSVRFWRGDPLTYPEICLTRNFPIITPISKLAEKVILSRFISLLKNKMSHFLGIQLKIEAVNNFDPILEHNNNEIHTQVISLCTPTQRLNDDKWRIG